MNDIKFGCSLLSWVLPNWELNSGKYAIEQTAKHQFDLLEILLPPYQEFEATEVKKELKKHNLDVVCSFNLPANAHIPKYPKESLALIKKAIIHTATLETDFLGGVLHSGLGYFSGNTITEQEKSTIIEVWQEASSLASQYGISIAIEPINRYESYVCNTAKNVLDLINETNCDNLFLHLDTFHMNIEENNFRDPILLAGDKLKHIHMTESHRGMLGEGTINWDELFNALSKINFKGNLVLENFTSQVKGMSSAVSLWQNSPYNAEDLAVKSLQFMKDKTYSFSK
ncbi:sugar phosphate isomerase/epimerase family protein [Chishuiella sp.]|uniref:sugar phosphate isomerase/epimerase family protein n=1 Tax=Chishuiella sp. TaxID=1969467 RepID=UPI0028B0378F|nr:sugar phosphate isomerase/epimerase family protein [Chishuiella sp.]